ncbi:MAG TPA: hypothetical protein VK816_01160, partial [Jatrophihabitantaceae bacterium]|nr:hypothetical protein [Jatrophihabitantaceae bacterium]
LVVARNAVGYLYEADETGPGSGIWGPWLPVDGQGDAAATDPSMIQVTKMSNGWTWFGVYRTAGGASRVIVPKSLPTAAVSRSANRAGSVSPGGGASFAQSETYQLPSPPQRH